MTAPGWVPVPPGGDFPVANLPYGVFAERPAGAAWSTGGTARVGVAIGEYVLDVSRLRGRVAVPFAAELAGPALNPFLALGPPAWAELRERLTTLLTDPAYRDEVGPLLRPLSTVDLRLPFEVADYVDFYASEAHATNVGRMFRPNEPPLQPNWKRLPVGYHGRAGTVVVSGTPIVRPTGQRGPGDGGAGDYGPCRQLDIEAEVGFVVGVGSRLGEPVAAGAFREHVFGVVLVNDWSARDIQRFETRPLGPFQGKAFATSISPWVVPLAALGEAWVPAPAQEPEPVAYLRSPDRRALDLALSVRWNGSEVSRPLLREMYWTPDQMLAQLTVTGANLRTGDLYASGTVSGYDRDRRGSLLELTWNGSEPIRLDGDGQPRDFLRDGDTVTIRATAPGSGGTPIGFGAVTGTILPARIVAEP